MPSTLNQNQYRLANLRNRVSQMGYGNSQVGAARTGGLASRVGGGQQSQPAFFNVSPHPMPEGMNGVTPRQHPVGQPAPGEPQVVNQSLPHIGATRNPGQPYSMVPSYNPVPQDSIKSMIGVEQQQPLNTLQQMRRDQIGNAPLLSQQNGGGVPNYTMDEARWGSNLQGASPTRQYQDQIYSQDDSYRRGDDLVNMAQEIQPKLPNPVIQWQHPDTEGNQYRQGVLEQVMQQGRTREGLSANFARQNMFERGDHPMERGLPRDYQPGQQTRKSVNQDINEYIRQGASRGRSTARGIMGSQRDRDLVSLSESPQYQQQKALRLQQLLQGPVTPGIPLADGTRMQPEDMAPGVHDVQSRSGKLQVHVDENGRAQLMRRPGNEANAVDSERGRSLRSRLSLKSRDRRDQRKLLRAANSNTAQGRHARSILSRMEREQDARAEGYGRVPAGDAQGGIQEQYNPMPSRGDMISSPQGSIQSMVSNMTPREQHEAGRYRATEDKYQSELQRRMDMEGREFNREQEKEKQTLLHNRLATVQSPEQWQYVMDQIRQEEGGVSGDGVGSISNTDIKPLTHRDLMEPGGFDELDRAVQVVIANHPKGGDPEVLKEKLVQLGVPERDIQGYLNQARSWPQFFKQGALPGDLLRHLNLL